MPEPIHLDLDVNLVPGHPPYERGRASASQLITLAVHGMRAGDVKAALNTGVVSLCAGLPLLWKVSPELPRASALAGTVLHLLEDSDEPDPQAVDEHESHDNWQNL